MCSKDRKLPVRNFVLIKRLEDIPGVDGGVRLVVTLVQYVFNTYGFERFQKSQPGEQKYFDYRFNDFPPNENELKFRRTEEPEFAFYGGSEEKCALWRSTFTGRLPLELETLHDLFPFKIVKATLDIELSSDYMDRNRFRPTLVLPKERTREGQEKKIRSKPLILRIQQPPNDGKRKKDIDATLDHVQGYELLSPYPRVCFHFDESKNYCSSYSITFYLKNKGVDRLISTIFPLILVFAINLLALTNDWKDDLKDEYQALPELTRKHLDLTSTLALTVVFLLKSIYEPQRKSHMLAVNNIYLAMIFVSLVLSAFWNTTVRIVGTVLLGVSFVIPLGHYIAYEFYVNKYKRTEEDEELFESNTNFENWDAAKNPFSDFFIKLECGEDMGMDELQANLRENGYTVDATDQGCNIYYGLGK